MYVLGQFYIQQQLHFIFQSFFFAHICQLKRCIQKQCTFLYVYLENSTEVTAISSWIPVFSSKSI